MPFDPFVALVALAPLLFADSVDTVPLISQSESGKVVVVVVELDANVLLVVGAHAQVVGPKVTVVAMVVAFGVAVVSSAVVVFASVGPAEVMATDVVAAIVVLGSVDAAVVAAAVVVVVVGVVEASAEHVPLKQKWPELQASPPQ